MKVYKVELGYDNPSRGILVGLSKDNKVEVLGLEHQHVVMGLTHSTWLEMMRKGVALVKNVTTVGCNNCHLREQREPMERSSTMMVAVVKSFHAVSDIEITTCQQGFNIGGIYGLFNGDLLTVTCTQADGQRKTRIYKNLGDDGLVLVNQPVGVAV